MSEEREFLHDIASPLTLVSALVEDTLVRLRRSSALTDEDLAVLEETLQALDRISAMVHKRGKELISDSHEPASHVG